MPIEVTNVQTNVQTKEIKDDGLNANFINAIMEFAQMVNIETVIMVNPLLL